jgi:transposase InsO family protein
MWVMDFIHDSDAFGKGVRVLVIMDVFTREVVAYRADISIGSEGVASLLKSSIEENGKPDII